MINNIDDEIRKPIPVKINKILDDEDNFEIFKQNILSDNSIDYNTKQIIIESKKEYLENKCKKEIFNIKKTKRINKIAPLIIKIKETNVILDKDIILKKINEWLEAKISLIELDTENLYKLYELINSINIIVDKKYELKKLFSPINQDEYIEYIEIMDTIKNQILIEEKNKEIKKLELLFIEEKKNTRITNIKQLTINLNKLSIFDSKIKIIKEELEIPINKYINLETDFIEISKELYKNTIEFINSLRFDKESKEKIIYILKNN